MSDTPHTIPQETFGWLLKKMSDTDNSNLFVALSTLTSIPPLLVICIIGGDGSLLIVTPPDKRRGNNVISTDKQDMALQRFNDVYSRVNIDNFCPKFVREITVWDICRYLAL